MKSMKKVFALVLTFALLLSLTVTAVAAGEITKTITINNEEAGHTYQAYQIFTGDLSKDSSSKAVLSNVKWGEGVDLAEDATLTVTWGDKQSETLNAAGWAEKLSTAGDDSALAKAFADAVSKKLKESAAKTSTKGATNYTITGLEDGYYLVKDMDGSLNDKGSPDAYTRFILAVVANVEVDPKSSTPTVDKQVFDVNDSSAVAGAWNETADHDIGDKVSFRLIGTLPSTYEDYKSYKYIFHDTLSAGLTLDENSIVAKVVTGDDPYQEASITLTKGTHYTVVTSGTKDSCSFHVVFDDLKEIEDLTKDHKIIVEYKATLNENAKVGKAGNPNDVYLEFSNNPNYTGDGQDGDEPTGNTPEDRVIVFTYELDVNKVNQDNDPLAGAGFTLYKKNAYNVYEVVKFKKVDNKYVVAPDGDITELKGVDMTTFNFVGLDDGDYKLEESTVPSGYNKAEDIEFTITATHNDSTEQLESVDFGSKITAGTSDNVGIGKTDVVNKAGSTLPSTGGIGTTIFYIVGGLMVLLAVVLLITKRRMKSKD